MQNTYSFIQRKIINKNGKQVNHVQDTLQRT